MAYCRRAFLGHANGFTVGPEPGIILGGAMNTPPAEYDNPWKEALEEEFESFLALCFPEVHAGIDWSQPVEFLDKELQQIAPD